MSNEIATQTHSTVPITAYDEKAVHDYLKSMGNKLTDNHRAQFMSICKTFRLNPFLREIYGIAYGDNFNIIVGYEVYIKRAERTGLLDGWEKGTKGEGKDLVGWTRIYRKGWGHPFYHEVAFSEYNTGKNLWASKPKTMIQKVAVAQAFRMCFSEDFGGMPYTADEMGQAIETTYEVAGTPVVLPTPDAPVDRFAQFPQDTLCEYFISLKFLEAGQTISDLLPERRKMTFDNWDTFSKKFTEFMEAKKNPIAPPKRVSEKDAPRKPMAQLKKVAVPEDDFLEGVEVGQNNLPL